MFSTVEYVCFIIEGANIFEIQIVNCEELVGFLLLLLFGEFFLDVFGCLVDLSRSVRVLADWCINFSFNGVELFLSHITVADFNHIYKVEIAFSVFIEILVLFDGGNALPVG
jgi:hypothetical protein